MHTVTCSGAGILGQWLSPMPECSRWSIRGVGGAQEQQRLQLLWLMSLGTETFEQTFTALELAGMFYWYDH